MKVNLKFNDYFVCAEQGGGIDTRATPGVAAIVADRVTAGEWETFYLEDAATEGGTYIKTCHGFYLTAEGGGGGSVRTNATEAGVWETFFEYDGIWVTWDEQHCLGVLGNGEVSAAFSIPRLHWIALEKPVEPVDRTKVIASYCSHRDHLGEIVFDPVYFGVLWDRGDVDRIDYCLDVKRDMGVTHVMVAVQGSYGDYLDHGAFDWRHNPDKLRDLIDYLVTRGFCPIVMVGTADSGTHKEIYDGTMQGICHSLVAYADKCWFCAGYEQDLDRGGGYNTRQMDDALLLMRDILGSEALLLIWLQPNRCTPADYWGSDKNHKPTAPDWNPTELYWKVSDDNPNEGAWLEVDGPYGGDEQGAYYRSGGLEIDGIYYQTDHGPNGPSYTSGGPGLDSHGQPRYKDRLIECADRFLERGTPMPGAQGHIDGSGITHTSDVCPSTSAPDWFASGRERGRPLFIVGETVPYEYIRGQCSDEAVVECCEVCESIGFPTSGCYRDREE